MVGPRACGGRDGSIGLQPNRGLRGTTGDLVAAIEAAGGLSRPPLRGGIVLAHGGRVLSASARQVIALLTPLALPIRRLAQPLAQAAQSYLPELWGMIRSSPARVQGAIWALLRRLGAGIRESGSLATRVRQDAQTRLRQAALERAERAKQKEARILDSATTAKVQQQLPGGPGATFRGATFRRPIGLRPLV